MRKYKIEITRTCTVTMTFEVEADDRNTDIDRAEQQAYNEEWHMESGNATYESSVIGEPELEEGEECPDCGSTIIEGPNKLECPNCGKFF
jgi:hypothetical protein